MRLTGIRQLDELASPLYRDWVVEFYGDPGIVLKVMHYMVAYRSGVERVYVLLNAEFGGIDTLYLVRLCRFFNCNLENVIVARAFRLSETVEALRDLCYSVENSLVVVVFPYSYVPKDPAMYSEATKITGLVQRASGRNQLVVFNTVTRHGRYMPEGGSFHHHLVKVIIRLVRRGSSILAELVKHPAKSGGLRSIPLSMLEHPVPEERQLTILRWIAVRSRIPNRVRLVNTDMPRVAEVSSRPL